VATVIAMTEQTTCLQDIINKKIKFEENKIGKDSHLKPTYVRENRINLTI